MFDVRLIRGYFLYELVVEIGRFGFNVITIGLIKKNNNNNNLSFFINQS